MSNKKDEIRLGVQSMFPLRDLSQLAQKFYKRQVCNKSGAQRCFLAPGLSIVCLE